MVFMNGIKYVNGDMDYGFLLLHSNGTLAGSYAVLSTAKMIDGTCNELGGVVMSLQSSSFLWRIRHDRTDTLQEIGSQHMWRDAGQDSFFLRAVTGYMSSKKTRTNCMCCCSGRWITQTGKILTVRLIVIRKNCASSQ